MRLALEYAFSIWSPLASSTSINKLQELQNAALRTDTRLTQTYNICMLPRQDHLQLHASQHNTNRNHHIIQHSKAKKTIFTNCNKSDILQTLYQQTFPQTPTQALQQTSKQTCAICIHLLSLGI